MLNVLIVAVALEILPITYTAQGPSEQHFKVTLINIEYI